MERRLIKGFFPSTTDDLGEGHQELDEGIPSSLLGKTGWLTGWLTLSLIMSGGHSTQQSLVPMICLSCHLRVSPSPQDLPRGTMHRREITCLFHINTVLANHNIPKTSFTILNHYVTNIKSSMRNFRINWSILVTNQCDEGTYSWMNLPIRTSHIHLMKRPTERFSPARALLDCRSWSPHTVYIAAALKQAWKEHTSLRSFSHRWKD